MIGAPCGCARGADVVGTCPQCLPAGAITWLIENGRQLELFEVPPEPTRVPGVLAFCERDDPDGTDDPDQVTPVLELEDGLPF